jgi:hypothetical protein
VGDAWGQTSAVGAYAGVRGDVAAVLPGVAPNPEPATVVADSDNSIPTTYVERDRVVLTPGSAKLTPETAAALLPFLPTVPPDEPGLPWNDGGLLAFTPLV